MLRVLVVCGLLFMPGLQAAAEVEDVSEDCGWEAETLIFVDDFDSDQGAWGLAPPSVRIEPGELVLAPDLDGSGPKIALVLYTLKYATDLWYCGDFILPDVPEGLRLTTGLVFWAGNGYMTYFLIDTDRKAGLWQWHESRGWTALLPWTTADSIITAEGVKNHLIVKTWADQQKEFVSLEINDVDVATVELTLPPQFFDVELKHGVYAGIDPTPSRPIGPVRVASYSAYWPVVPSE